MDFEARTLFDSLGFEPDHDEEYSKVCYAYDWDTGHTLYVTVHDDFVSMSLYYNDEYLFGMKANNVAEMLSNIASITTVVSLAA